MSLANGKSEAGSISLRGILMGLHIGINSWQLTKLLLAIAIYNSEDKIKST